MINTIPLQTTLLNHYEKQRKVYPCHTNRASDIGHPCMRYLVFSRTRWADKLLPEIDLQIIFSEGNAQEEAVKKTLSEAGFILTQQQRSYVEAPQLLTGHLDTFIEHPQHIPKPIPAEIKGLSQFNWESINSLKDMIEHKAYYVRKYPAQMMTYLYMTNEPEGLFILKNKQSGKIKFIPIELDLEYMESLLKKSEEVNRLIDTKTTPQGIDDLDICQGCPFRHVCFKDQSFGNGVIALDDDSLSVKVAKLLEIEPIAKEYDKLKETVGDQIKERAKSERPDDKKADFIVGDYVLSCSQVQTTKYNIPDEVKAPFAEKSSYWKLGKILKV